MKSVDKFIKIATMLLMAVVVYSCGDSDDEFEYGTGEGQSNGLFLIETKSDFILFAEGIWVSESNPENWMFVGSDTWPFNSECMSINWGRNLYDGHSYITKYKDPECLRIGNLSPNDAKFYVEWFNPKTNRMQIYNEKTRTSEVFRCNSSEKRVVKFDNDNTSFTGDVVVSAYRKADDVSPVYVAKSYMSWFDESQFWMPGEKIKIELYSKYAPSQIYDTRTYVNLKSDNPYNYGSTIQYKGYGKWNAPESDEVESKVAFRKVSSITSGKKYLLYSPELGRVSDFSIDDSTDEYDYTWLMSKKCEIEQGVIYASEESACTLTVTPYTNRYYVKYPDGLYLWVDARDVYCYQRMDSPVSSYSTWRFTAFGDGFVVKNDISDRYMVLDDTGVAETSSTGGVLHLYQMME